MSEYIPTTEEIRAAAGDMLCPDGDAPHEKGCPGDAMFDRWLAAHDEQVRTAERERCAQIVAHESDCYALTNGAVGPLLRAARMIREAVPAEQKERTPL